MPDHGRQNFLCLIRRSFNPVVSRPKRQLRLNNRNQAVFLACKRKNNCVLGHMQLQHVCVWDHGRFIIQRGHEPTRTGNWSESGFGSLRGAPLNISRCLGGEVDAATLMAALSAGPPPPVISRESNSNKRLDLVSRPKRQLRLDYRNQAVLLACKKETKFECHDPCNKKEEQPSRRPRPPAGISAASLR